MSQFEQDVKPSFFYHHIIVKFLLAVLFCGVLALFTGCQTTRYYQRRRVSDRCMKFGADGQIVYIRNKIEAAREASLGGFGSASAGGCGCQ